MKFERIKKFIVIAWPFLGLALFLFWGWLYIKPLLPEDFFSWEKVGNKILGIFQKEEGPVDPDAKYAFIYAHDKLKPATRDALELLMGGGEDAVDNNNNISGTVHVCRDVACYVSAVTNAQNNDVIKLASGTYETNLEITKNITIIGSSTILIADDPDLPVIKITGVEINLKNLTIKNARIGIETENATLNINNVKFSNLNATACYVRDSKLKFTNSQIKDSGSAIKAINSSGVISRSIIENNQKSGVDLRNSEFKITENIITKNGSYGVFADQSSKIEIEGNYIDDNKGFEVRVEGKNEIYR